MFEKMLEVLKETATGAGFPEPRSPIEVIGSLIGIFLSFLGIIFFVLVLYGGFLWMISAGNESKVAHAKSVLRNAVIGLIIILSAYSITYFVMSSLVKATIQ